MFNAEFYGKPYAERNYDGVLSLAEQAVRSAARQFGAGSGPHLATLRAQARYLGLSASDQKRARYDKQLQIASKIFAFRTAKMDKQSLPYANALVLFCDDLTYYYDPHRAIGIKSLQQAVGILAAKGDIKSADLANSWSSYASTMVAYGGRVEDRISILANVVKFQQSENPMNHDVLIYNMRVLAADYQRIGNMRAALRVRNSSTAVALDNKSSDRRRNIEQTFYEYGDLLLMAGNAGDAERELAFVARSFEQPDSTASAQFKESVQKKLAEAKTLKVELAAKAEAARRAAVKKAATDATQKGEIAPTPALAAMFGKLKTLGVRVDAAGAKK